VEVVDPDMSVAATEPAREIEKGLKDRNPLPYLALGARVLDAPPDKTLIRKNARKA
jgi:hypothetical protein